MPLEWVSVSQRLPVHPWEGTCDWQSEILFVDRGPKEHTLKFHFLNQIIQSLSHTKMYIKIKKKAKHTITSTVESTCKSLTRRIVTTTDSTFVSPCLGIQNMITACLLQKNTIPCHSAQCKTMKTYNVNFPLPKNIFIHCIYLVFLGNSWKTFYVFGCCNVQTKHSSCVVQRMYNPYTLTMPRTVQEYVTACKDFV